MAVLHSSVSFQRSSGMSWQEEANTELVELLWGKFNYYNISISYESRSVLVVNLTAQRGR